MLKAMCAVRVVALLAVGSIAVSGCLPIHSAEEPYRTGVARVGDSYLVFPPLCAGEAVVAVHVYDNAAAGAANIDPYADPRFTWWRVESLRPSVQPSRTITLGDDAPYQRVLVEANAGAPFPEIAAVGLTVTFPGGSKQLDDTFTVSDVPTYDAGTDPATVKYSFHHDGERTDLTMDEISKKSKCARDYPY